jgi:hypothetical protein
MGRPIYKPDRHLKPVGFGFGFENSPVDPGVGLILHPNRFCCGSGFLSTRPEPDPLPSLVPNFEEVRKWRVAPNDGANVLKALVQPPKDVENEDPVFNGCAEVSQIVGHGLELAAVLIDRLIERSP